MHCTLKVENNSSGEVSKIIIHDSSSNGTYIDGEKIGKGNSKELCHGQELSLGVPSSKAARKSNKLKDRFVSFMYKSSAEEMEDIHAAFEEADGPSQTYTCSKTLGSGAFAEVRLCLHKRTGKKFAAKIVDKKKFALNKELRSGSFKDEVEILKTINNPYIVRVEDIYETDTYLTIILQYVSGGDLFDKVVALKRYDEESAKIVFYQMAHAVKYLHDRGIAHRDLKPENFLVLSSKSDLHVLMGDFGLARVFDGSASFMKTLCGTPQYLAPEIVKQAKLNKMTGYTQAVDVWALGVVLYILLAGYPPFGPKDFDDIVNARFDFSNSRWKTVSTDAKNLITRMLKKEASERISIQECCSDVWLHGVTVPPSPEDEDLEVQPTTSQVMRVEGSKKARVVETKDKVVRFESIEKERNPTDVNLSLSDPVKRKLKQREPTGIPKRGREEQEEDEEEEKEELKKEQSQLKKLKVVELKEKCRELGLSDKGKKDELIKRIEEKM